MDLSKGVRGSRDSSGRHPAVSTERRETYCSRSYASLILCDLKVLSYFSRDGSSVDWLLRERCKQGDGGGSVGDNGDDRSCDTRSGAWIHLRSEL